MMPKGTQTIADEKKKITVDDLKKCVAFQSLSSKKQLFVLEYVKDFNATQAAIRAKYSKGSAHVQGPRLLENDSAVSNAIDEVKALLVQTPGIASLQEVLEFLSLVLRGNIRKIASWNEQGLSFKVDESEDMNDENSRLIKRVKVTEKTSQKGDWTECKTEVELHDPVRAAELLGKYHGAFTERVEHSGQVSLVRIKSNVKG